MQGPFEYCVLFFGCALAALLFGKAMRGAIQTNQATNNHELEQLLRRSIQRSPPDEPGTSHRLTLKLTLKLEFCRGSVTSQHWVIHGPKLQASADSLSSKANPAPQVIEARTPFARPD
ncbi:hypothetical protein J4P02_01430 [Pseudomonas sp. NFXW11]|uniref:hypothetical protein n=1 Tax=Pseudomonas sp. NFXW11 TaxID=2819531 RepID=UPI003CECC0EF